MFENEIEEGKRFEFGKNWKRFLSVLSDERIAQAELSLKEMLDIEDLKGKRFLDIGSGSGLFSLAARRLGAQVHSLDYDPQSVACTAELKNRYYRDDGNWVIERGSALDAEYIKSLGKFDVVYSWGVLHHTGQMWKALDNAQFPVDKDGILFIAIYDDQGLKSKIWLKIKQFYCSGSLAKYLTISFFVPFFLCKRLIIDLIRFQNPVKRYTEYNKNRGMSVVRDWIDWLGGLPYEFATSQELIDFYRDKGLVLVKLNKGESVNKGMNELVLKKSDSL